MPAKEETAYKIVYSDENNRKWSLIKMFRSGEYFYSNGEKIRVPYKAFAVRYYIRRWTKPLDHCGPLAVFRSEGAAENFMKFDESGGGRERELWECKAIRYKGHKQTLWISKRFKKWLRGGELCFFPSGTMLCSRVKLIKKVS